MARERYLVGVNKEELERKPSSEQPMTAKEKWKNFWFYHKWVCIFVLFLIGVATVAITDTLTREHPDYTVTIAADGYLPDAFIARFEAELATCGKDVNGDGKVQVTVQFSPISTDPLSNYYDGGVGRQAVMAHIMAFDVPIFALDPSMYDTFESKMEEGKTFFAPLTATGGTVDENGTYLHLNLLEKAKKWFGDEITEEWETAFPTDLYFGVRATGENNTDEQREKMQHSLELLNAYALATAAE